MLQTDIFGENALFYFERFDAYKILETSVIDSVMIDLWNSKIESSGNFLDNSTCYNVIQRLISNSIIDYEKKNRFYSNREVEDVKPHRFVF